MRDALTGKCLCGDVRYSLTQEPLGSGICHCTHCARQSGSLMSMVCVVPSNAFQLEQGELTVYQDIADSGNTVLRKFCRRCGSPIVSELLSRPGVLYVKAGTLDDWHRFQPKLEIYRSRAAEWFPHFVDVTSFAEGQNG
ncbi:hypothetical protein AWL63_04110 [Sphingomonas panacis]|uniref:CENP-V/GFA domain-containing protein n=1 Tax=Sphingomonas panacis TaxID=1560345 RepID=A0A1B3Z782_9SPHN|nr:GFA family protein [Sphingomonas panacis]AOH83276.1 hypothetical protein AWL63_04110 [Sphingomonas panacis]